MSATLRCTFHGLPTWSAPLRAFGQLIPNTIFTSLLVPTTGYAFPNGKRVMTFFAITLLLYIHELDMHSLLPPAFHHKCWLSKLHFYLSAPLKFDKPLLKVTIMAAASLAQYGEKYAVKDTISTILKQE